MPVLVNYVLRKPYKNRKKISNTMREKFQCYFFHHFEQQKWTSIFKSKIWREFQVLGGNDSVIEPCWHHKPTGEIWRWQKFYYLFLWDGYAEQLTNKDTEHPMADVAWQKTIEQYIYMYFHHCMSLNCVNLNKPNIAANDS